MLIIFDMGGVCTNTAADNMKRLNSILGITSEQFSDICGCQNGCTDVFDINDGDLFALCGNGIIGQKGFWEMFSSRSGIKVSTDWWHWLFHPQRNEDTYNIIEELKQAGHRVVCGTNTMESHYQNHIERGDYLPFDQTYTSHIMGISKPDTEFWSIILKAEDCNGENAVFIDDKEENCAAAEKLGIHAIRFTSAEKLRTSLVEMGLIA